MKVMGGKAVNGWKFWSLEGDEPASAENAAKTAKATARAGKSSAAKPAGRKPRRPAYKVIHPDKNQDDLMEGEVRWACDACIKSWVRLAGEEPTECPNGHKGDDAELTTGGVETEDEAK
jgi:hypothetical protein